MAKIAVVTDTNSGITKETGEKLGIYVLPMPFTIDDRTYYEGVDLSVEQFFSFMEAGADIKTSQPEPGRIMDLWDGLLKAYDEIVHIPMSSGLSSSCETAAMLADDYDGRVQVVNNQRISVTQKQSAIDAVYLAENGKSAAQIKEILEREKFQSSIYITLNTLYYLKKGGRITPAAAALGTILRIKPVLQIQGEKLDAFAKARTMNQAKSIMLSSLKNDVENRFGGIHDKDDVHICVAHTQNDEAAEALVEELKELFGVPEVLCDPLSLSVSTHIGPGALAVACSKKIPLA